MRRSVRVAGIFVAIVIGLGLTIVMVAAWLFWQATATTTKISAYPTLLKEWAPTGLVDHFPAMLQPGATDISLAELPSFMQGSGAFQLRMRLPPDEIEAIARRARAKAVRSCPNQCSVDVEDPEYWHVPRLAAGSESEKRFPPDFVIYALETNGDWNHPRGKGIAISVARHEVVYWAED